MNFLGIQVDELDPARFLAAGRILFALLYLAWLAFLWRSPRIRSAWPAIVLALLPWFLATYPLQRLYGLESGTDRQRNLWWCATAAAGNAPWESGVVGGNNLEPAWAFFVAALSMFDPARVMRVYEFLPALAIVLIGLGYFHSFRQSRALESPGVDGDRTTLLALLVVFFILLAPTGPLDYLSPYRGFWQRMFLLKPNHALGLALLPLFAALVTRNPDSRRTAASALLLGVLGWTFVVHWALACFGLAFYAVLLVAKRSEGYRGELVRLVIVVVVSLALVLPYLYYLVHGFPVVEFPTGAFPDDPKRSIWGDSPPRTHSLFFLATLDLGPTFLLACLGTWICWTRGRRFDLLWLGLTAGAYVAWIANAFLLSAGQARQSDEIYFFLVTMTAVQAAFALEHGIERLRDSPAFASITPVRWTRPRAAAAVLLLWFPLTLPWWWNPGKMDSHFRLSLNPIPERLTKLGAWIRGSSEGDDVFLAGSDVALWIPALTGRRVLRTGKPWLKTEAHRNEVEILTPANPQESREALTRLGIDFVVLDLSLRAEHRLGADGLDGNPFLDLAFESDGIKVYRAVTN